MLILLVSLFLDDFKNEFLESIKRSNLIKFYLLFTVNGLLYRVLRYTHYRNINLV